MAGEIVGGVRAVTEALDQPRRVNRVYAAKESRAKGAAAVIDRARNAGVAVDFVPQAKLNELCATRDHQGIAAAISPLAYETLEEWIKTCPAQATVLALDQVQHPKNLGMAIRSASAAGAACMVLPLRRGALLDDSVVRASAGTAYRIPIVTCTNLSQAMRALKKADFWIYGLDGAGESTIYEMSWPERVVVIAGNETDGLRPGVRKSCDEVVRIPLHRGVESLNVAVAAAVTLFEIDRSRTEAAARSNPQARTSQSDA